MNSLTRRAALGGLVAGGALLLPRSRSLASQGWKTDPFTLGVAAGEPRPDSVLLWTRLAPDPLSADPATPGGMSGDSVPLTLEVATDDTMRNVIRRETVTAEKDYAWSVHAEVAALEPGRPYWYRFTAKDAVSPIGRAMTAPAAGAQPDKLRFAYFSCSNYEMGYFSAYRHAADEMPDFGIFLGDYIYEYPALKPAVPRRHSGGDDCKTLAQYRNRHAQYRTDADLQRLHALVPSLITWDDHDVQNDYADKWSQTFDDPDVFLLRRGAAYQAFYEHMPIRNRPSGPALQIYDRFDFGDLLQVDLIDGRQYRSREACYAKPDKGHGHPETKAGCPELLDPSRSMIGMAQEAWLFDGLARSKARWNLIAQDVLMAQMKEKQPSGDFGYWTDDWNGYPESRARLLQQIQDSKPANPVVITGDIHSFWANDLKLDFDNPDSPTVATEFVGSSVTSMGPKPGQFEAFLPDNPHMKYFNGSNRGYVSVDVSRKEMNVRFRAVTDVTDPKTDIRTLAAFTLEDGRAGVVQA
ncbi:MAG TPA: alkaline phosphatase D family protein [Rhizomicrobium sp.]|jgi:alkaline phosphatase D